MHDTKFKVIKVTATNVAVKYLILCEKTCEMLSTKRVKILLTII